MENISFNVSREDAQLIHRIARRYYTYGSSERPQVYIAMDLTAAHARQPLRLADLLAADPLNFVHDVGGICANLDRETGHFRGHFLPRFTVRPTGAGEAP